MAEAAADRPRPEPARTEAAASDATLGVPLLEVEVPAGDEFHWLRELTGRWPVRANVRVCRPLLREPQRLLQLVELLGAPDVLEAVERHLLSSTATKEVTVARTSPSRRLVRAVAVLPPSCDLVLRSGAVCTTCRFLPSPDEGRRDRWTLLLPRSRTVEQLLASLRAASGGDGPQVYSARRYRPRRTLSHRQALAIETAYRMGFYAFPRRTNLHEIARNLGISRSATAELLRRAEGKMLDPVLSPS